MSRLPTRATLRRSAWALLTAGTLWFALQGGEFSTGDLLRLRQQQRTLLQSNDSLARHVDSLRTLKAALDSDTLLQERIAREEFGMVRGDHELLYRFADTTGGTVPDSGPGTASRTTRPTKDSSATAALRDSARRALLLDSVETEPDTGRRTEAEWPWWRRRHPTPASSRLAAPLTVSPTVVAPPARADATPGTTHGASHGAAGAVRPPGHRSVRRPPATTPTRPSRQHSARPTRPTVRGVR